MSETPTREQKLTAIAAKCRELLVLISEPMEQYSDNPKHVADLRLSEAGWKSTLLAIEGWQVIINAKGNLTYINFAERQLDSIISAWEGLI